MFVPVPAGSHTAQPAVIDEPRDMAVALRLLSGKDCERDARRAHEMLVHLSESRSATVREDAARLLKAGVSNKWFTEQVPKHYELERIAEKTLSRRDRAHEMRRLFVILGIGFALLIGGLTAFVANQDPGEAIGWPPFLVAATMALMFVFLALVKAARKR